jgi:hypothetical protein
MPKKIPHNISSDFRFNLEDKMIEFRLEGGDQIYTVNELYSFIQDFFDEPEMMRYDIPIKAASRTKYFLINGWKIDLPARKHLKGGLLIEKV